MSQHYRDPETAARIEALGRSPEHPDLADAMKGKGGKRPKICQRCGKPLGPGHQKHKILGRSTAEKMDRGEILR